MGKRSRRRGQDEMPDAPEAAYTSPDGDVLTLRGAMTLPTRQEYATLGGVAAATQEDAWQRRVEFLFERLAVRWDIAGTEPIVRQRDLLAGLHVEAVAGEEPGERDGVGWCRRAHGASRSGNHSARCSRSTSRIQWRSSGDAKR